MRSQKILYFVVLFAALFVACSENSASADDSFDASVACPAEGLNAYGEPNRGSFTDSRDGQVYKYTTIGSQVWMAENLNYAYPFSAEDTICDSVYTCHRLNPSCTPSYECDLSNESKLKQSECAEETCTMKGRVYYRTAALDDCPDGWHLPDNDEWQELFASVGGADSAGLRLKATSGWTPLNPGQPSNGTDDCGFSLLPVPIFYNAEDENKVDGYLALVWSSSMGSADPYVAIFETNLNSARVMFPYYSASTFRGRFFPVRCVKD